MFCLNPKQIATQMFVFFVFFLAEGIHSNMTYLKWDKYRKIRHLLIFFGCMCVCVCVWGGGGRDGGRGEGCVFASTNFHF